MVIGQMVCGAGEADRWLAESLNEFKRICDDALIVTCNATQKEIDLIKSYGFQTYEDNREWGREQPYIKTELLKRIRAMGADIVLALDADETVPTLDRESIIQYMRSRDALNLYVTNLWNDGTHYSPELSFWNIRVYRPSASDEQFLKKPVHCGNAPPYFYNIPPNASYVPHILLHKGLMRKEDRMRKVERYNKYDPNAIHKGREYYDALSSESKGREYNQDQLLAKLREMCNFTKQSKTKFTTMPNKFYYVKRDDNKHLGSVIEIPESGLDMTLKLHPTWKVVDETDDRRSEVTVENAPKAPEVPQLDPQERYSPIDGGFLCDLCEKSSRTVAGIKSHIRKNHV